MAENTIDNLSIQVVASAEKAISVFNRLASGASKLKSAALDVAGGMQDMAQGAKDAGSATQQAGTQSGKARPNIKGVGKDAKDAGENAKKGSSGLDTFWQSLKRIAYYRMIRSIIKAISQAFKEGAQNLYQWSAANPSLSDFAKNMDRIATSVLYLKNSLGALLEPIVRILTPVIEWVVDKLVWLIDKVNQFFAALSGAETYTAAKKVAQTWGDTSQQVANNTHKAAEEIKRTILGFDEINKLDKPNSGSYGGGSGLPSVSAAAQDMFEERPLEGWAKTISDFIRTIASWIDSIFGPIKQLFSDTGDAFDDLNRSLDAAQQEDKTVNINVKINTTAEKLWNDFVDEWDAIKNKVLFVTIRPATLPEALFKMVSDAWDGLPNRTLYVDVDRGEWDNTAWLAANMTSYVATRKINVEVAKSNWDDTAWLAACMTPYVITRTIKTEVLKGGWDDTAWLAASMTPYTATRTIKTVVEKGEWNDTAWLAANMTPYYATRVITSVVKQGDWNDTAWLAANMTSYTAFRTVFATVKKGEWDNTAWTAATMTAYTAPRTVTSTVKKGEWDAAAWLAANMTVYAITRTVTAVVQKGAWDATAWTAATMTAFAATRTITSVVNKGAWDATAWTAALMTAYAITRTVTAIVKKGDWDDTAWTAATMTNYTVTRTVNVELKKKDWTTVTDFVDDSFGGSTGGGGNTSGGGAGRTYGVDTKLNVPTEATLTDWWNATTTYWGKLLQAGGVVGLMVALREPGEDGMKTLASKIAEAWDALLQANKLTYGVIVQPVANKTGEILSNMGNKIGEWLFGTNNPTTSVTVNGTPGNGFTGELSGTNTYTLKGIEDTSVNVDAAPKWASTIGGLIPYLKINDLFTTITAKAKKGWKSKTFKAAVGASDTSSTITANLSKGWGGQNPINYLGLSGLSTTIKVGLKADGSKIKLRVKNGQATIESATNRTENVETPTALGGVFSNGRWSRIPQYANGTTNAHGSLFLAGEAGPEIVGHVGGRTEVLNKSQLASAMYAAVRSAMAPASSNFAYAAQNMSTMDDTSDMEALLDLVRRGSDATERQNELLRQQNEYLRSINDKDYNIEVSTSSINKAQTRANRRAGITLVPVGT